MSPVEEWLSMTPCCMYVFISSLKLTYADGKILYNVFTEMQAVCHISPQIDCKVPKLLKICSVMTAASQYHCASGAMLLPPAKKKGENRTQFLDG
jgi:hypothetical protein